MKSKLILFFMLVIILFLISGCSANNDNGSDNSNGGYTPPSGGGETEKSPALEHIWTQYNSGGTEIILIGGLNNSTFVVIHGNIVRVIINPV